MAKTLSVAEQLKEAERVLDRALPTYKGVVRPLLDRMQVALPDIELMGSFTRGGRHLYDVDGAAIDYIPGDHFAYLVRPNQPTLRDPSTARGRIVPCPFCGVRVQTMIPWDDSDPLLIIACPNISSPDPVPEHAGEEVCDWYDRDERARTAARKETE